MLRSNHLMTAIFFCALAACSPPAPPVEPTPATTEVMAAPEVVIDGVAPGARLSSPLLIEGAAPGDWYFEAQFDAKLIGADGATIAEAPARAQSDWMTEAPVRYRAEFTFRVTQETPATLVLQEDMPADNSAPREVTIPVILVPR